MLEGLLIPTRASATCYIDIREEYRYVLAGGTALNASHYNPAASDESAILRTPFHLAMTLVHELTHAWDANTRQISHIRQPFCNDQRIAEEGMALEVAIWGGRAVSLVNANQTVETGPFGCEAVSWPGCYGYLNEN